MLGDTTGVVVYAGEDAAINIRLTDQLTHDAHDLTTADEVLALLQRDDGLALQKRLTTRGVSILSAGGGRLSVLLTAADTKLLRASVQPIELRITSAGSVKVVQIPSAITVQPSFFPNV